MRYALHSATEEARDVLAALRAALDVPVDEAIDDDEIKLDTVEGETDLFEQIDYALEQIALATAHADALAAHIKTMQDRKRRYQDRIGAIRTALAVTMEVIEEKKLERPTATISLPKARTGLEIDPTHEHEIPDEFIEVIQPEPIVNILDKAIILALKDGREIKGCQLVELPRSVTIRSK